MQVAGGRAKAQLMVSHGLCDTLTFTYYIFYSHWHPSFKEMVVTAVDG